MISKFDDFKRLFTDINASLKQKVTVYVIGGAILLYHGLKTATKDIDLIVDSETEFRDMEHVLTTNGFSTKTVTIGYEQRPAPSLAYVTFTPVNRIHLHVRRYSRAELPKDAESQAAWIQKRFEEKEQLLSDFERLGHFPSS